MSTLFYHHSKQCCELEGAVSLPLNKMNAKSGRCLSISGSNDRVVLNPMLKTEYPEIKEHFKRVGLKISENILWQDYNKPLDLLPSDNLSTYCYSPTTFAIDHDKKRLSATSHYLLKSNILKEARHYSIPTPKTTYYKETSAALSELDSFNYPLYIKPDNSSDGIGIIRCESKETLKQTLNHYPYKPFLIQEEICADHFLSLHFHAQKNNATHIFTATQIIEKNATIGHQTPYPNVISEHVLEKFTKLAQQLVTEGIREYFGFDLAAIYWNKKLHYLLMECNPRYTFATYPAIIAKKLNIKQWQTRNYRTQYRHISQLGLRSLEFNRETNSGIIVIDWGMILLGELTVMLIGNKKQQQELDRSLSQSLLTL